MATDTAEPQDPAVPGEPQGLADPAMLAKIDRLFACGAGELVDLPQIVVVGDQSSGKSSVLEGLIDKPLPRDSGLCTRFATQIVFRRAAQENILVSIIPDRHATPEHTTRVKAYQKTIESLDSAAFKKIMDEVHTEMGLAKDKSEEQKKKPTFSNDVLHLEISGPKQEHLSVIDVPGIFKSTTKGLTTKEDIELVRSMVKSYMDNPRSVMLAVIPSNVDVATQEILQLAVEADPPGDRTLGVLTKPDLVDRGAEPRVIELIDGRAHPMKLGWHMIRNPGQMDLSNSELDRSSLESNFFRSTAPWNIIEHDKVGIGALRSRLKEVLAALVKNEFPKVKAEIKSRLTTHQNRLSKLGSERGGTPQQLMFLTEIATKFQRLVSLALNANYGADDAFKGNEALRIAPAVMTRNKMFSDDMAKYGHSYDFLNHDGSVPASSGAVPNVTIRKVDDPEALSDLLHPNYELPQRQTGDIKKWLNDVFLGNRGFELGTFNPSILATTMREQSSNWEDIGLGYVSDVIAMVHNFIVSALISICPDEEVLNAILASLSDDLLRLYQRAMDHAKFLLLVENDDSPTTLNHYFNDNLQKSREGRIKANVSKSATPHPYGTGQMIVPLDQVVSAQNLSNDDYVIQDIHDILKSYYKVSRKTFVDIVCKQCVAHFLLKRGDSPLALFSPIFVSSLKPDELAEIAGEAPGLQRTRNQLKKEISSLSEAMKILVRA